MPAYEQRVEGVKVAERLVVGEVLSWKEPIQASKQDKQSRLEMQKCDSFSGCTCDSHCGKDADFNC